MEVTETLPPYPHHKVVAVDFDGTLVKWDLLDAHHERPLPGAREALLAMKAMGKTVAIFTSRLDPTWLLQSGNDFETQYRYVAATLRRLDIPFDFITGSKVAAYRYADDRALEFSGDWNQTMASLTTGKSSADLAWFAGIFEGEGWIYVNPRRNNSVEIGVEMTDADTVQRINAIFPGNTGTRQRLPDKRLYRWRRSARPAVVEVLQAISPWLSARRLAKAQEVIWATQAIVYSVTTEEHFMDAASAGESSASEA